MNPELKSRIRSTIQKCKTLLMQETADQLEAVYGHKLDGRIESVDNLPEVLTDEHRQKTLHLLLDFIAEEERSGMAKAEAVAKLVNETAFTHLNRLVALKMMEARKLIRQAVARGSESNGFKFFLADHPEAMTRYNSGQTGEAYQEFLLWQYGEIASRDHLEVLFDPANLPSRLFPRPRALATTLELLNAVELAPAWEEDETIGWVYQYFIEEDKDRVFEKIYKQKQKMALRDIPKATQIFTPRWIVEYLVHNTLGRLWLRMHPDSALREKMKYFVPNPYNDKEPLPLKPVAEITLLDPACGTMHFGLVAFDLFHEMYHEELIHAGEPGWPSRQACAIASEEEIPQGILENNIFGIDIDLRAIQLSALTLYLKMKSRNPHSRLRRLNLTYTDFPAIPEAELPGFIATLELSHPIAREVMAEILPELNKAYYLGSLLKIEERVMPFLEAQRREMEKFPLLAGADAEMAPGQDAELFWRMIRDEIILGLQKAEQHLAAGQALIAGAQIQGLGLVDALLRKYDVVTANPPFSGRRNWDSEYALELKRAYPKTSSDMYAVFIERCIELAQSNGLIGMICLHTFMFTSSYQELRESILGDTTIQTMNHVGPIFMDLSNPFAQQATSFVLQLSKPSEKSVGIYLRMVRYINQEKLNQFERTIGSWQTHGEAASDRHIFVVRQEDFKAIPAWPFVYWISSRIRYQFENLLQFDKFASTCQGLATSDNARFLNYCWEIPKNDIFFGCNLEKDSATSHLKWYPYMKGGDLNRWYGNQDIIINWQYNGLELKAWAAHLYKSWSRTIKNVSSYYYEGATYSFLTVSNLSVRYLPPGFIFDVAGSSIFPKDGNPLFIIALLNAKISTYLIKLLNPTVNYQVGDLARLPFPDIQQQPLLVKAIESQAQTCIHLKRSMVQQEPISWEFNLPPCWQNSLAESLHKEHQLTLLENDISAMVYELYNVAQEDIQTIEEEFGLLPTRLPKLAAAEINEQVISNIQKYYLRKHIPEETLRREEIAIEEEETEGEEKKSRRQARYLTFEEVCIASGYHPDTVYEVLSRHDWQRHEERFDLAYAWLEYAFGILMGRFKPGQKGELGSAIIHKNDFITGSLSISDQEFNDITRHFPVSYEDDQGKHAFPQALEEKLRGLADSDGIMVLDPGHREDLPARLEETLVLLLGDKEAAEVIAALINENLPDRDKFRRFLERDFFSKHHVKMYRKRPIYWLLQSQKKSYGFYLFHERINGDTLYKLQRIYIDPKLNHIDQQIRDLGRKMAALEGAAQRQAGREREALEELYQEIKTFSEAIARVIQLPDETGKTVGYDPDINDGVILNMAPLHSLIPWSEPEAFWKELQSGRYDWAHLAMRYWPNRVREKCKTDKSLAIAHGVD